MVPLNADEWRKERERERKSERPEETRVGARNQGLIYGSLNATFLGWTRTNGKVGCSVDGKHRAGTVIPAPGQSATIRLCLLFFLLVARPVPQQPRTCSTSASARVQTPRA